MTLWEGLVALMTVVGVGWILFVAIGKKNPAFAQKTAEIFSFKDGFYKKSDPRAIKDKIQQTYEHRGGMM